MFVRVKTTPNSPKKAVQIVEAVRKGAKVFQKIVRHVGFALDEQELAQLKLLAETIKIKLEADGQQLLFSPEKLASLKKPREEGQDARYNVNLKDLIEEQRIIDGVHDVYGELFDQLGYRNVFKNPARKRAAVNIFRNIVLARLVNPKSKRATVDLLEENFGVCLNLDQVYQTMDLLDDAAIERLNTIVHENTVGLFGGKIDVVFFDATTVYFESFTPDILRDLGYSKDLKFKQPQILLALMVTKEGLPLGYRLFPGNTYEGHTLIPALQELRRRYAIDKVVAVADGGMFNRENLKKLEDEGFEYIVGARLKNLGKELRETILDRSNYSGDDDWRIARFAQEGGKKLVVSYKAARALKDLRDREKAIEKLRQRLEAKKNPRDYLSNQGYKKYLKVTGEASIELDAVRIEAASRWDGLHGVVTNAKEISDEEILAQYVNLWHVEDAFRITKHDLKIRPVFHWTPRRVRAHVAICFAAYALATHLVYRVRLQYKPMSVERIRNVLAHVQTSILYHVKRRIRFALPSRMPEEAKRIYRLMRLTRLSTPWLMEGKM